MIRRHSLVAAALLSGLLASSTNAQVPDERDGRVWRFPLGQLAPPPNTVFLPEVETPVVAGGGDVDGDGYADLALGRPDIGQVLLISGRKGVLLRSIPETPAGGSFGTELRFAGDLDGDGADDLLIAAGEPGARTLSLVSGASGATLSDFGGVTGVLGFTPLGDVNEDQIGDVALSIFIDEAGAPTNNTVQLRSGADGSVIRTISEPLITGFGAKLVGTTDLDGDLVADLMVGSPAANVVDGLELVAAGRVDAYSGRTGERLFGSLGSSSLGSFSAGLSTGHDVDGDGLSETLAFSRTSTAPETIPGTLHLLSGVDGDLLHTFPSTLANPGFDVTGEQFLPGRMLAGALVGDVNGDGVDDIATAVALSLGEGQVGLRVHSGKNVTSLLRGFDFPEQDIIVSAQVLDAGDVNADGLGDVLFVTVGATGGGETGALTARLVFGGDPWEGRLGDRVEHITSAGKLDAFFFEAAAGTRVRATVKRLKGSTLAPALDLVGPLPFTSSLVGEAPTTNAKQSAAKLPSNIVLPETGRYRLDVLGDVNGGGYRLKTSGSFKHTKGTVQGAGPGFGGVNAFPGQKVLGTVAAGETTSIRYILPRDAQLSVSARRAKGSTLSPQLGLVFEGDGELVVVFPEGTETSAKSAKFKKIELVQTGNWRVDVVGANDSEGDFVLKTKLKPLRGKAKLKLPKPHQVEG